MKTLLIVMGMLLLAGCGSSAEEPPSAKKEQARKNIMGTGADIKLPDPKNYEEPKKEKSPKNVMGSGNQPMPLPGGDY